MTIEIKKILKKVYEFKLTNPSTEEEANFMRKTFLGKYLLSTTLPKMERFGTKSEDILNITNAYLSKEQTYDGNYRLVVEGHMFHVASNINENKVMFVTYESFHKMEYRIPNDYTNEAFNDGLFETFHLSSNEKLNEIMDKVLVKIKEENIKNKERNDIH